MGVRQQLGAWLPGVQKGSVKASSAGSLHPAAAKVISFHLPNHITRCFLKPRPRTLTPRPQAQPAVILSSAPKALRPRPYKMCLPDLTLQTSPQARPKLLFLFQSLQNNPKAPPPHTWPPGHPGPAPTHPTVPKPRLK